MDYYAILEIPADAGDDVIRDAFHRKAQQYHPDKVAHLGAEFREIAERKMREINEAYEVLRDPECRRAYDESRSTSKPPAAEEATPSPAAPQRADARKFRAVGILAVLVGIVLIFGLVALFFAMRQSASGKREQEIRQDFQEAVRLFDGGHWEQSLVRLHHVTTATPEAFEAWNLRWQAEARLGLMRDAAKSLEQAVALKPTDVALRVEYARALFHANRLSETRAQLRWLASVGETPTVVRLMDYFRSQNPDAAAKLAE